MSSTNLKSAEFNQVDLGRAVRATERLDEQYGLPKGSFGRLVASPSTAVSRNQPASLLEYPTKRPAWQLSHEVDNANLFTDHSLHKIIPEDPASSPRDIVER